MPHRTGAVRFFPSLSLGARGAALLATLSASGCGGGALPGLDPMATDGGPADLAGHGGRDLTALPSADLAAPRDLAAAGERFSFFVTSLEAMRKLSGSQDGFGGDLRFGEATGLAGADKICTRIADLSMPGSGRKGWRAFLSAATGGPNGGPAHAIQRIGNGPWYDRIGRLVAMGPDGLVPGPRPSGDPQVVNDLPNELGIPNRQGTDNHDTLTGSNRSGMYGGDPRTTCNDWSSAVGAAGRPIIGHSWPRNPNDLRNGGNWLSDHPAPGCAPGVNLIQNGPGNGAPIVGGGGGYGGIYCFALVP